MPLPALDPDWGQEWAVGGRVTRLDIIDMGYGLEIEGFVKYLPHITELAIACGDFDIKVELARLAALKSLTTLHIPRLRDLGFGYVKLKEEVERAKRQVKRIVRNVFPRLRFLSIEYDGTYDFSTLKTDDVDELDQLASM
ncbi:hypothetical protein EXIGLDRAFT_845283 [Exidia glandulosa HHB12029]|uniref:Uncharacterized protein n=1 Tax=Exidia glandulosa HHB12029 TaxID=1314781 RepID=A0A165BJS9_EXIGL|nr:hypothetical protein EXIGLDRAFT_845283 [Exidia glandulosa HHB12029]